MEKKMVKIGKFEKWAYWNLEFFCIGVTLTAFIGGGVFLWLFFGPLSTVHERVVFVIVYGMLGGFVCMCLGALLHTLINNQVGAKIQSNKASVEEEKRVREALEDAPRKLASRLAEEEAEDRHRAELRKIELELKRIQVENLRRSRTLKRLVVSRYRY